MTTRRAGRPHRQATTAQAIEDDDDLEAMWGEFRRGDRVEARPRLIVTYAALVTEVADEVKERVTSLHRSDLVSYGLFGLIGALDEFDPEQEQTFERFATERIREAMLRELWAP